MADFLTHLTAARVPAVFMSDRRLQALLVLGTFLPDLADKGMEFLLRALPHFTAPTHSLAGLLVLTYLAALFVEERLRRPAWAVLYAGALLHVGIDLLKYGMGAGAAFVFFPFSTYNPELGLIRPEDVVLLAPANAAILLILWLAERRRERVRQ